MEYSKSIRLATYRQKKIYTMLKELAACGVYTSKSPQLAWYRRGKAVQGGEGGFSDSGSEAKGSKNGDKNVADTGFVAAADDE